MGAARSVRMQSGEEYQQETFFGQEYVEKRISGATFDGCTFTRCRFDSTVWKNLRFNECTFTLCTLLNVQWHGTRLHQATFSQCRLTGLNFGVLDTALLFSIALRDSRVAGCTFPHMDLTKMAFTGNDLEECLFDDVVLRDADFSDVSFGNSRFRRCRLEGANFRGATGFALDPRENELRGARFSVDSALELVKAFGIEFC